jgi:hypothetical protein
LESIAVVVASPANYVLPRPDNGQLLKRPVTTNDNDMGELRVSNDTGSDAAVFLVSPQGATVAAFYVYARQSASLANLPASEYRLQVMLGKHWTGYEFANPVAYSEVERSLVFTEVQMEVGRQGKKYSVTLNAVGDGNARIRSVAPFRLSRP